ncbi:virulence factor [Skunkpox virus]|uniref:Virulence factor n=1 Tax=Skunkpox virus TaxID=160796 RepID=A0A1C9KBX8_9POXV|nr:virulence factor [Skunkpox virus]AOP31665.1 virulence factor [Skunkpox virus]
MRSFVILLLLFPSIVYSRVIKRCSESDESTWELKVGMCIQSQGFYSKRTDCSVHRPEVGGGLITEGNGFRVVMHDSCTDVNPFIITDMQQTHFGLTHTYLAFGNSNTKNPDTIPECSKNVSVTVYCDQEVGELDFHSLEYIDSSYFHLRVKYDTSCINYLGVEYSYMDKCSQKLGGYSHRDTLTCGADSVQIRDSYLKTCTNTKFDRSVYKKYMIKSKSLHYKTEL